MPSRHHHALSVVLFAALGVTACGATGDVGTAEGTATGPTDGTTGSVAAPTAATDPAAAVATVADTHDDADDLTWDTASEIAIALADGATTTSSASGAVSVDGDTVTITAAGTYRLTGTLTNGQVVIETDDEDEVRLILDGVTITSSTSAAIAALDAEEVIVILATDSQNTLADATTYVYPSADVDEPNAALFSTADLTIGGDGALIVTGNANDAIASKDGLIIAGGETTVGAVDDGIRGKDYLIVKDGTLVVTAGGDGLKADNEEDAGLGYVRIIDGAMTVTAGADGIEAVTSVAVEGGTTTIAATDDGIHSEAALTVSGGTIDITASYEGLEGTAIVISGGDITLVADDDGLNVAGGDATMTTGTMGRGPGGGGEEAIDGWFAEVTGGTLVMTTGADGIDSNGSARISGGIVVINGPTRGGGEGAVDVNGTLEIAGGVLVGSGGVAMGPRMGGQTTAATEQAVVTFQLTTVQAAGTVVQLQTESGDVVLTFEPAKGFQSFIISSPDLDAGTTYQVVLGGSPGGTDVGGLSLDAAPSGGMVAGTVVAG